MEENSKSKSSFNNKVWGITQKIPKGKVATYGQIARILGSPRKAREVGWAMHANKSSDVPCHRVVDRNGRVAPNFAFDGADEQRRRLEAEGVSFSDSMHVDLEKCLWTSK